MSDAIVDPTSRNHPDMHVDSVSRVYEDGNLVFVVLGSFSGIMSNGNKVMREQVRLVCSRKALADISRDLAEASAHFSPISASIPAVPPEEAPREILGSPLKVSR